MGLGLFLARAVIEGVGGSLQIDSIAGEGTEVSVTLPTDVGGARPVADRSPVRASRESLAPQVVSKPS
jgi:two-component system sensor histidine kinase RegB